MCDILGDVQYKEKNEVVKGDRRVRASGTIIDWVTREGLTKKVTSKKWKTRGRGMASAEGIWNIQVWGAQSGWDVVQA